MWVWVKGGGRLLEGGIYWVFYGMLYTNAIRVFEWKNVRSRLNEKEFKTKLKLLLSEDRKM